MFTYHSDVINHPFHWSVLFISSNMTNLKLSEQKKLVAEARARRGDQSASKSDLMGIQTRALKRKKLDVSKVAFVTSDP